MTTKSTKTAPAVENTESAADIGNLSEQQQEVLGNAEPAPSAEFQALSDKYSDAEIDEQDLQKAVREGRITAKEYALIAGEDYIEPSEKDESEFQARKIDIEERLAAGKLNSSTAFAQVDYWTKRKEITEDVAVKLRQHLGTNITKNETALSILHNYKPEHTTLEACKQDGAVIAKEIISATVEIETSKLSRLTLLFADFAFLQVQENKLPASPGMADALWSLIVDQRVLGEMEEVKDENGAVVGVTDPYRDSAILPYIKPTCQKACLLAYGEVTRVRFGYIHKDHAKQRINSRMVFDPAIPEGANPTDYLRSVCVPSNFLRPFIWSATRPEEDRVGSDGKTTKVQFWLLVPAGENRDESLRNLSNDVAKASYAHYFNGEELVYDTRSDVQGKVPSGMIIGSTKPMTPEDRTKQEAEDKAKRATGGTQKEGNEKDNVIAEQKQKIAQMEKDLRAVNDLKKDDIVSALAALGAYIRDTSTVFPDDARTMLWKDALEMFKRRSLNDPKNPTDEEAFAQVQLLMSLDGIWKWDDTEAAWLYHSVDGNLRKKYAFNGSKHKEAKAA